MNRAEKLLGEDAEENKNKKELLAFLTKIEKQLSNAKKDVKTGQIRTETAGMLHMMAGAGDEDWYSYYFR